MYSSAVLRVHVHVVGEQCQSECSSSSKFNYTLSVAAVVNSRNGRMAAARVEAQIVGRARICKLHRVLHGLGLCAVQNYP